MLSAVLCGCNETGTFSEKKYTPVYVYLSTTPYVGESSMSDFVDYPSDLVRLGLQGTVKEVKTTSAAEMVQKFNEDASSLLPSGRQPITRFSEFYRSLLALEDAGVKFTISVDEIIGKRSAAFYIELDYIMNSSDEIKKLYTGFRQCWYDMKEIGIEIHESPVPVNGNMNILLYSDNIQLIALFHAHIRHLEEKKSPMYEAEIEDTLQIFNVPIKEYA